MILDLHVINRINHLILYIKIQQSNWSNFFTLSSFICDVPSIYMVHFFFFTYLLWNFLKVKHDHASILVLHEPRAANKKYTVLRKKICGSYQTFSVFVSVSVTLSHLSIYFFTQKEKHYNVCRVFLIWCFSLTLKPNYCFMF